MEHGKAPARLRQGIARFPPCLTDELLVCSGQDKLFLRLTLRDGATDAAYAIVWLSPKVGRIEALRLGKGTRGYAGLARCMKCLGVRVNVTELGAARAALAPTDPRFTPENRHLNPKRKWEMGGVPIAVDATNLVQLLHAWGWTVLPGSYEIKGWVRTWEVSADTEPPAREAYLKGGKMWMIHPIMDAKGVPLMKGPPPADGGINVTTVGGVAVATTKTKPVLMITWVWILQSVKYCYMSLVLQLLVPFLVVGV